MAARQKEKEEARALLKKKELEEKKKEHLRKVGVLLLIYYSEHSSHLFMGILSITDATTENWFFQSTWYQHQSSFSPHRVEWSEQGAKGVWVGNGWQKQGTAE